MSYGRNPHYIWSDGENLNFEANIQIPEYLINAFLYKIFLKHRREELKERLLLGKEQWIIRTEYNFDSGAIEDKPQDQEYIDWMNNDEDEFFKELLK